MQLKNILQQIQVSRAQPGRAVRGGSRRGGARAKGQSCGEQLLREEHRRFNCPTADPQTQEISASKYHCVIYEIRVC